MLQVELISGGFLAELTRIEFSDVFSVVDHTFIARSERCSLREDRLHQDVAALCHAVGAV